jgi:peptidoglycan/LPS O-acetylase OafA/YrhL
MSLLAAVGVAAVLLAALGPDGLPKEGKQTATPWYGFVAVGLIGVLMILIGGHGAATRQAMSLADDREFSGAKAVIIGALQCVGGAAAVGLTIYALAACPVW